MDWLDELRNVETQFHSGESQVRPVGTFLTLVRPGYLRVIA